MSIADIHGRVKKHKYSINGNMLLKYKHFPGLNQNNSEQFVQMEHSYSRDWRPAEGAKVMTTRTVMVHRAPQCPSCHIHSNDEGIDLDEPYNPPIPSYNHDQAREAMETIEKATKSVKNINPDDLDWEASLNKLGWTVQQQRLFTKVGRILDLDRLARLAHRERQHEAVLRRADIDQSVQRMRQALASVSWEPKLTQWIHGLLMDHLPHSYMVSYLDILQTLKAKLPTLVDKMLFGRPISGSQDILAPVMKEPWEPIISHKNRKLPLQPIIIILPTGPTVSPPSSRLQKWYSLFATMGSVKPIAIHAGGSSIHKQGMSSVVEQLVSVSRAKIQEIRTEAPNRPIILVGFNAGAALTLQIGLLENISCIICMGFAYNTIHGVRGAPDDHILDLTTPVLFVVGQNSARCSQEEIETLREQMQAQTSVVIVGSADDSLRVSKTKRQIENVTQTMVDNMVMDEVAEFATTCLLNPPGPRQLAQKSNGGIINQRMGVLPAVTINPRKRKISHGTDPDLLSKGKTRLGKNDKENIFLSPFMKIPTPVGRPRIHRPPKSEKIAQSNLQLAHPSSEALDMAIQSILPPDNDKSLLSTVKHTEPTIINSSPTILTSYEISPGKITQKIRHIPATGGSSQTVTGVGGTPIMLPLIQKKRVKVVPPNQFVQLKPAQDGTQQKVYALKTSPPKQVQTQSPIYTIKSTTTSGNKIYTVNKATPQTTQIIQTSNIIQGTTTMLSNPPKFTIMKPVSRTAIVSEAVGETTVVKSHSDLSTANIFDMPIVFADSDGNIQDTVPITQVATTTAPTSSTAGTLSGTKDNVVSGVTSTNRSIIINNILANKNKQNKVVFINRNAMKSHPNIISKSIPPLKYTKVFPQQPGKPIKITEATTSTVVSTSTTDQLPKPTITQLTSVGGHKMEILNSSMLKGNAGNKYQPIIINVDSDKTTIKNMIKVNTPSTSAVGNIEIVKPQSFKAGNTIVIKPNSMKQIPMLKPGILNKNLTVRKVVNIIQQKPQSLEKTNQSTE